MLIMPTLGFLFRYLLMLPLLFNIVDAIALTKEFILLRIKYTNNLNRWRNGDINIDDLHSLTPREFEFWCGEFISKFGYTDIVHSKPGPDGGKDIVCIQNSSTVYVECKRYLFKSNASYIVDDEICRKFVGAMMHDEITKGLIITSGIISSQAIDYLRTLPKDYEIQLLDGGDILKQYSYVHQTTPQTV